jgi:hypothetical protein
MKKTVGILSLAGLGVLVWAMGTASGADTSWTMKSTIIEACTCPMFCQCYFSSEPHHSHNGSHYCKFNMAYKVEKGKFGSTKLDGVKFWLAGDLGDNFGDGEAEWVDVTFEPSVTKEQREAIAAILPKVYPVKWKAFNVVADAPIEWSASVEKATAKLDGGKGGEISLIRNPSAADKGPTVIKNLRYFGASRNDGFVLMPNEVQAYRLGKNAFESKGTNGFMITHEVKSSDYAKPAK